MCHITCEKQYFFNLFGAQVFFKEIRNYFYQQRQCNKTLKSVIYKVNHQFESSGMFKKLF